MKIDKKRIAILDIGTNTFHILIVELDIKGSFNSIHREKIPVKLGQGGINNNIITDEAISRAKKAFTHFNKLLSSLDVTELRTVATSAVRNAHNGQEFVLMAKSEFDIDIEVINGIREAELIHKGVKQAINLDSEKVLIIDIGGGSIEFIICDNTTIFWKKSFEIGGQRLLEKFHKTEPITIKETHSLLDYINSKLEELINVCNQYNPTKLIGASGAFDTLSDINRLKHNKRINDSTNYYTLPKEAFIAIHKELINKTKEERLAIPGMIEMRVEMIVINSLIINYVLEKNNINNIITSKFALKEGLAMEVYNSIP